MRLSPPSRSPAVPGGTGALSHCLRVGALEAQSPIVAHAAVVLLLHGGLLAVSQVGRRVAGWLAGGSRVRSLKAG